ncbi:hypothetical protein JKP88DRAFT_244414 [Tribonema minus]|uniref:Multicopper oxidase n=1 Tax=Tribonema minus TaxID=303371 RepID=A0A836CIZ3_9STRA|nr:hypothetical protein JKP88DRAFT_244414 [Tribonema minus]
MYIMAMQVTLCLASQDDVSLCCPPVPVVHTVKDLVIPLSFTGATDAIDIKVTAKTPSGTIITKTASNKSGFGTTSATLSAALTAGGAILSFVRPFQVTPPQWVDPPAGGLVVEPVIEFASLTTGLGGPRPWMSCRLFSCAFITSTLLLLPVTYRQMHFMPGSNMFITVHKEGQVRLFRSLNSKESDAITILDIKDSVNNRSDNGLYTCRFDPKWPATPYMYCTYTDDRFKDPAFGNDYPNKSQTMYNNRPTQWHDVCSSVPGNDGYFCEGKMHIERFKYDPAKFASAAPGSTITPLSSFVLFRDFCSDGGGHGLNDIVWVTVPGKADAENPYMVLAVGDKMCWDPTQGAPQNQFRAMRDAFMNGKMVAIPRTKYAKDSTAARLVRGTDYFWAAAGLRNPVRLALGPDNSVFAAVVGDGVSLTSELIVQVTGDDFATARKPNFCWPCVEGRAIDSVKEYKRRDGVNAAGWTLCDSCWHSRDNPIPVPSTYEYFPLNYSDCCSLLRSQNTVFFSDYTKQCTYYLEKNPDGSINWAKTGPDGFIYGTDFDNARTTRISYQSGLTAGKCMVPLHLLCIIAGYKCANLSFDVVEYTNSYGTTRTRAFNLYNPTIRMKACGKYLITLTNDLAAGWGDPTGAINTLRDPQRTNLHVHGLHISGNGAVDNVVDVQLSPGGGHLYKYEIPCDHASGLHFYHTHHHGSASVQAGGGAVGLIVIEDNPQFEGTLPGWLNGMPERHLLIEVVEPEAVRGYAKDMSDTVYTSTATKDHYLINKCTSVSVTAPAGRWTRLRMLHVGGALNAKMRIGGGGSSAAACAVGLVAKDGVYVSHVPRALATREVFFSVASRADVVVRCSTPGTYPLQILRLDPSGGGAWTDIGSLAITKADAVPGPYGIAPLPTWRPCRPAYLQSLLLEPVPTANQYSVLMQTGVNGALYSEGTVLKQVHLGQTYEWQLENTITHPWHMHVNHMQASVAGESCGMNCCREYPGWHVAGDWVDTYSGPDGKVRFRPERYAGYMIVHCHVYVHADKGMMALVTINGVGPSEGNQPQGECAAALSCYTLKKHAEYG